MVIPALIAGVSLFELGGRRPLVLTHGACLVHSMPFPLTGHEGGGCDNTPQKYAFFRFMFCFRMHPLHPSPSRVLFCPILTLLTDTIFLYFSPPSLPQSWVVQRDFHPACPSVRPSIVLGAIRA